MSISSNCNNNNTTVPPKIPWRKRMILLGFISLLSLCLVLVQFSNIIYIYQTTGTAISLRANSTTATTSTGIDFDHHIDNNNTENTVTRSINERVLCVQGKWYGRTANRVITLANALAYLYDDEKQERYDTTTDTDTGSTTTATIAVNTSTTTSTTGNWIIGLTPDLSTWYIDFLDERHDIRVNYTDYNQYDSNSSSRSSSSSLCTLILTPEELFYFTKYYYTSRYYIQQLIPKYEYRVEAQQYMTRLQQQQQQQQQHQEFNNNNHYQNGTTAATIVTVHRRNLEGHCINRARQQSVMCFRNNRTTTMIPPKFVLVRTCRYNYNMIIENYRRSTVLPTSTTKTIVLTNATTHTSETTATTPMTDDKVVVLLCTDGQVPQFDDTFPLVVTNTSHFAVETWIMTLSNVHYGNPMSTVDYIIAIWRTRDEFHAQQQERRTHPESCYT